MCHLGEMGRWSKIYHVIQMGRKVKTDHLVETFYFFYILYIVLLLFFDHLHKHRHH